jgi:hypothetical protein
MATKSPPEHKSASGAPGKHEGSHMGKGPDTKPMAKGMPEKGAGKHEPGKHMPR